MKVHYYTNIVEGLWVVDGRTVQVEVLIKESALDVVVR